MPQQHVLALALLAAAAVATIPSDVSQTDLLFYYSFDNAGSIMQELQGRLTATASQLTSTAGRVSNAASFNAASPSTVTVTPRASFAVGLSSFSVCMWIRPAAVSAVMASTKSGAAASGYAEGWAILWNTANFIRVVLAGQGGKSVWLDYNPVVSSYGWNHFCMLIDRSTKAKMYLNGTLMSLKAITRQNGFTDGPLGPGDVSTLTTLDGTTTCAMTLGYTFGATDCSSPTTYTTVAIDEFGLWKRLLTTAEVSSLAHPANLVQSSCDLNESVYDGGPSLVADSETGFTSLNQLVLKVQLPMATVRNYTLFQIGRTCTLAVATTTISGCNSTAKLAPFAWSETAAQACGMVKTVSGTVQTWTGVLSASFVESYTEGGSAIPRTGIIDMLFTVRLETAVSVQATNISVFSIPGVNPIITGFSLAVGASGVSGFSLEMSVGVKKPFTTTWPRSITFPGAQGTVSFTSAADLAQSSSYTWRKYIFAVTPAQGLFSFTNVPLAVNFTLGCLNNAPSCSGIGNSTGVVASFLITTGSWLPTIAGTASVSASLALSNTAARSSTQNAFFVGDKVYARITFTAAKVSISDATCTFSVGGADPSATKDAFASSAVDYSFALSDPTPSETEKSATVSVGASCVVVYQSSLKRDATMLEHETVVVDSVAIEVQRAGGAAKGSASSLTPWF
eukprot:m51a1_g14817 hypothetical protein (680) ;mRNA; r:626586-628625